jgi:DNA-binding response OmpR family regulator
MSLRIMVADDERDAVETLVAVLSHAGHEVRGVHRARDVLRNIERFDPDVVLMDIRMPELNGWDAAREIRARYGSARPMLIAMSGIFRDENDTVLSRAHGFDHHLVKPYDPADIFRLVASLRG